MLFYNKILCANDSKPAQIESAAGPSGLLVGILSSPAAIFLVALAARIVDFSLHSWFTAAQSNHLFFAYEIGEVAQSIVEGHGFSSPFGIPTGPTAWYTPVYPLLLAAIFKVFGTYSFASAWVITVINCVFSALTAVVMIWIGKETVGAKPGIIAAWIWALLPYVMQWSVRWVWDTSLSALLLATMVYATLRVRREPRVAYFILLGLLWGLVANSNPTLLSCLPVSLAWIWWRQRPSPSVKPGIAAVLILTVLACAPWVARNYITMHYFGLRSNFGEELYLGNQPGAEGLIIQWKHPIWDSVELREYQRQGEIAYIAGKRRLAVEFIKNNPDKFAVITLKRIAYFWCGAPDDPRLHPSNIVIRTTLLFMISLLGFWGCLHAIRRKIPGGWLLLSVLIFYPLAFYITHTHVRYRHPVDPVLFLGAVYLFTSHSNDDKKPEGRIRN